MNMCVASSDEDTGTTEYDTFLKYTALCTVLK